MSTVADKRQEVIKKLKEASEILLDLESSIDSYDYKDTTFDKGIEMALRIRKLIREI